MIALSAVMAGIRDIREAVERAQMTREQFNRRTIMFVDGCILQQEPAGCLSAARRIGTVYVYRCDHREPFVRGQFALLSRAQVYVLEALDSEALATMFSRAGGHEATYAIDADAQQLLIDYTDGDGRRFLNSIRARLTRRVLAGLTGHRRSSKRLVDSRTGALRQGRRAVLRPHQRAAPNACGSGGRRTLLVLPHAGGGADPLYVAATMIRMASDRHGLADRALEITLNAGQYAFERLGSPEGELALAEACVFCGRG